jgi:hypothetical protein
MFLNLDSYTSKKSQVILRISGANISQQIKLINKKGTFKSRAQCKTCAFTGQVQIGLGYAFDTTCDINEGFWKMRTGITTKVCTYFKEKVESVKNQI